MCVQRVATGTDQSNGRITSSIRVERTHGQCSRWWKHHPPGAAETNAVYGDKPRKVLSAFRGPFDRVSSEKQKMRGSRMSYRACAVIKHCWKFRLAPLKKKMVMERERAECELPGSFICFWQTLRNTIRQLTCGGCSKFNTCICESVFKRSGYLNLKELLKRTRTTSFVHTCAVVPN